MPCSHHSTHAAYNLSSSRHLSTNLPTPTTMRSRVPADSFLLRQANLLLLPVRRSSDGRSLGGSTRMCAQWHTLLHMWVHTLRTNPSATVHASTSHLALIGCRCYQFRMEPRRGTGRNPWAFRSAVARNILRTYAGRRRSPPGPLRCRRAGGCSWQAQPALLVTAAYSQ